MQRQPFADDPADRHARAERAERILEHDLDAARASRAAPPGRRRRCARRRAPSSPSAIGCSASSARPSVVLPEPDSPTMPSVSPRRSSSVARRTASKRRLRNQPCAMLEADADVARVDQHRRVGRHRLRPRAPAGSRAASACRRCCGAAEHLARSGRSRPVAALHDADSVREAAHEVEVVRDEEERHAHLGLQLVEQGEDLRLDRHVEGGRRLVGDEQLRGRQASAIAIIARWRWPPESWCG